jgi:hypothetical protein
VSLLDFVGSHWHEMVVRPAGPMGFRFILQPVMASILAIRDGIKDAKTNRSPYFWTIATDQTRRRKRLVEGIHAVSRVLILAALMDIIYQLLELNGLRPLETAMIAVLLAFVPYMIVRGPAARIAKRVMGLKDANETKSLRRG